MPKTHFHPLIQYAIGMGGATMTSFRLKIIAIITMTIDHLAKILISQRLLFQLNPNAEVQSTIWIVNLSSLMEWVGRIAFPLFAFMIVEGCSKTRSMPKYAGRLALFAIISQPFYYVAFNTVTTGNGVFSIENLLSGLKSLYTLHIDNIFTILALGALSIWIFRSLSARKQKWLKWLIVPILGELCFVVEYIHVGYGAFGILLIFFLSLNEGKSYRITVMAVWLTIFYLGYYVRFRYDWLFSEHIAWSYLWIWVFSLVAPILLFFYNGKRGSQLKWVFYVFYPVHLIVICAIKTAILF
jgi:hypothetical protein